MDRSGNALLVGLTAIMRRKLSIIIISGTAAGIILASAPVSAQIDTYGAVRRYNRVSKGTNVNEWHRRLFDDDPQVRLDAVESLGKDGSPNTVKPLLDAVNDSDPRVRAKAIDYLGRIGSPVATLPLTQYLFLKDVDKATKQRILVALGRIGDPDAVPRLIDFANETQDHELRCGALFALGEIGDEGAMPCLEHYRASDNPHEKRIAEDAIGKIKQRLAAVPNQQPTIIELEKLLGPQQQGKR